jgi:hypothetical protein
MSTRKRKIKVANESVHDEFTENAESKAYKCNHCSYELKVKHTGNMESHLMRMHKDIYEDIKRKRSELTENQEVPEKLKRISIYLSTEEFKKAIVEIVTVNGRPLQYLEDSGFQKIIKPILGALPEKLTVSRRSARPWIHEEAEKLREEIKIELADKIISAKMDLATRLCRSVMGVNVQLVKNGRLRIFTLAMRQINESHTAENLLIQFEDILKSYGIVTNQIYRFTTDNGSNTVKMGQLLRERASLSLVGCETSDVENSEDEDSLGEESESDSDSECDVDENQEGEFDDSGNSSLLNVEDNGESLEELVDLGTLFRNKVDNVKSVTDILRCFEHSLQLGPSELIKKHVVIKRLVRIGNKATRKMRTSTFTRLLETAKMRRPILSNKTRWGSTFLMLKRLLQLRQFCDEHSKLAKELKISPNDWRRIEKLLEVFKPIYETTIFYQRADLTVSEAYAQWIRMRLQVESTSNEYTAEMLRVLRKHANKMLNDDCVLAGVFLDPRFQILLDDEQKIKAKDHIKAVYNFLKHSRPQTSSQNSIAETLNTSQNSSIILDPLERLLASLDGPTEGSTPTTSILTLEEILNRFEKHPRISDANFNVLKFWTNISGEFLELQEAAFTIFSAASTQVSVERAFSALKFILSDQRGNLEPQLLEDILLLYLNQKFK